MNVQQGAFMRTSNVWNRLSILLATVENQENLCRGGWSRDLPDAYVII